MRRRFYKLATTLTIPLLAGACVQMTRHSNTIVFGTNTSVGLRVGSSAASIPEIQVGYSRQEAVVMPVVANTGSKTGANGENLLEPCDLTQTVEASGQGFVVHPCSLVAVNGKALDSYSVLASFGANFDGSANTSQVGAKGGLAQYFATGMAAQLLAANGGAAVVAVGEAATKAAQTNPGGESARSLFGDSAAYGRGVAGAKSYPAFKADLLAKLGAVADDASAKAKIEALETNAGITTTLRTICAKKADCLAAIGDDDYAQTYNMNAEALTRAIGKW